MVDLCDILGDLEYANKLFKQVDEPNIFLYNAILRSYTHKHVYSEVIAIYKQILRYPQAKTVAFPDKFTFPIVIKACAGLVYGNLGKQIHGHVKKYGPRSNIVLENSLMDMYTKCDDLMDAQKLFDEMLERDIVSWNTILFGHTRLGKMRRARAIFQSMPEKTIVSWTTLISGYTRIGCYSDALDVFWQMQMVGLRPDEISIVSVLPACAHLGALELGKWIHIYSDKNGLLRKTFICNALIEMYAKCGSVDQAWELFCQMVDRDVISWSTMIAGFANHGKPREAVQLFAEMEKARVEPNSITFLGLLSACAHAGFLAEGIKYLDSMRRKYLIDPSVEHYGCIVDLLGRLGYLEQAIEFIRKMPVQPDSSIWGSLLSACRTRGALDIAVIAMEQLVQLEPDDIGNYVLLSNIYADLGKWDCVSKIRKVIRSKRMKKTPGCSLIEVNNVVQEFVVGDDSNPFSDDIYCMLELLFLQQSGNDSISKTYLGDSLSAELESQS
ncbi:Pentatricopeptide repeat-containing protein [Thalictrum thalictroides]|uniref:Pentatricopeptide repeat-containing protein n=1 Tax=Thalictrum thalictroides TaxID=46969 RepID=A0A7J6XFA2_THATH|nr:Pentatricopeptide repeat-containing protein [Thalictrum thalictroides]